MELCIYCRATFSDSLRRINHEAFECPAFNCRYCHRRFHLIHEKETHEPLCNQLINFTDCLYCKERIPKTEISDHHSLCRQLHQCFYCPRVLSNQEDYFIHLHECEQNQAKARSSSFRCDQCRRKFRREEALLEHQKSCGRSLLMPHPQSEISGFQLTK